MRRSRLLELAQRIDPELNAIDRFALSLAYYLKRRYDAAIEQAELNLRQTEGANFSRIVLAAAYAQLEPAEDAARVVTAIRRTTRHSIRRSFGSKFLKPAISNTCATACARPASTADDAVGPLGC